MKGPWCCWSTNPYTEVNNFWHWNLAIDKANFLFGSKSKHHCFGLGMVIPHAKQGPNNQNITWILVRTKKIWIRSIGFTVRVCVCVCELCVIRLKGSISFWGRHWRTSKVRERTERKILEEKQPQLWWHVKFRTLSLNRNWILLIMNEWITSNANSTFIYNLIPKTEEKLPP